MKKFTMPKREQQSNKGTFGKVLNFCGSDNYIGAAYLATVSSLKVGAGLSALASTERVLNIVPSFLPEAIYFTREEGLEKINDFTVVLIGCGLGLNKDSEDLFSKVLTKTAPNIPIIIDADGLNILAKSSLNFESKDNLILTPHPLEASRLLNCSLNEVLSDIEGSAKRISQKYKCVTVLKTHHTVICNKDLTIYRNLCGNSALAKSGTGDVLAGIIAGLLAQGVNAFEASKLGVYLHARTGEIISEHLTEYSVLASDLPKYLHKAIKELIN
ncbi:NAD(P)H-hydrate dehydratase [bacterium]|nr:NAD(P)H-hydrate dehydratase [bacterium]